MDDWLEELFGVDDTLYCNYEVSKEKEEEDFMKVKQIETLTGIVKEFYQNKIIQTENDYKEKLDKEQLQCSANLFKTEVEELLKKDIIPLFEKYMAHMVLDGCKLEFISSYQIVKDNQQRNLALSTEEQDRLDKIRLESNEKVEFIKHERDCLILAIDALGDDVDSIRFLLIQKGILNSTGIPNI